nr:hypothetical protein [Tanacetum cinerariifolium]
TKDLDDVDAYWIKKQKQLIRNKLKNDMGAEDDEDEDEVSLPSNTIPTSSAAVLEPHDEWANAMVDGPNHEMTHKADDANLGMMLLWLYSVGGKGDGSLPSSTVDEERIFVALSLRQTDCRCVVVHPADPESCHCPKPNGFPSGTFSIAGQASVGSMAPISLLEQRLYCHVWPLNLPGY